MNNSRRNFLQTTTASLSVAAISAALPVQKAAKPLRILILGGTGFIGPHQVRYALARGHKLTLFNRGKTNPGLFPDVEHLAGDRQKSELDELKNREWDVVIDNPTTIPRWVREAGAVLKGKVNQYVFISTISVFSDHSIIGMDENAPLATTTTPDDEKNNLMNYGALKALSEKEAEKAFPGRATIIRPGLIVGPGDPTDRFTYWPVRINRGGEILAPGDGTDPMQFIDARDLGEWSIRMVEQGAFGIYNATGPKSELSTAETLYGIRAVTTADVKFTWADWNFLQQNKVSPWSDMPVWVPGKEPSMAGFARINCARAIAQGLTFRSLAETAAATIEDFSKRPADKAKLSSGLSAAREAEILKLWHESQKAKK